MSEEIKKEIEKLELYLKKNSVLSTNPHIIRSPSFFINEHITGGDSYDKKLIRYWELKAQLKGIEQGRQEVIKDEIKFLKSLSFNYKETLRTKGLKLKIDRRINKLKEKNES